MTWQYWPPLLCPIIPMKEIGGVQLRMSRAEVLKHLGEPAEYGLGSIENLKYYGLTVFLKNDSVYSVMASPGYRGMTADGLKVAMPWLKLIEIHPDMFFNEEDHQWHIPDIEGLTFDIVRPPKPTDRFLGEYFTGDPNVSETYGIENPEQAFVWGISVTVPPLPDDPLDFQGMVGIEIYS